MSKKNTNRAEVYLCVESGKPLRATNSNVHSECLERALADSEIDSIEQLRQQAEYDLAEEKSKS